MNFSFSSFWLAVIMTGLAVDAAPAIGTPPDAAVIDPVTLEAVAILGPDVVLEQAASAGSYRAQALMSDGSIFNVSGAEWGTSLFTIARSGTVAILSTGEVLENRYATLTATVTLGGVTKQGSTQVQILNTGDTFDSWRAGFFSAAEIGDPELSGPLADIDGDGVSNLLEFAFNLNPRISDRSTLVAGTGTRGLPLVDREVVGGQPRLTLEFVRRRETGAPGITCTAQFNSELANAADWVAGGTTTVTVIDAVWERVKVTDLSSDSRARFARLKVTLP